jgi:hypothetical protein
VTPFVGIVDWVQWSTGTPHLQESAPQFRKRLSVGNGPGARPVQSRTIGEAAAILANLDTPDSIDFRRPRAQLSHRKRTAIFLIDFANSSDPAA